MTRLPTSSRFTRRGLLAGLGAGGVLVPLLATDHAQGLDGAPKRLIVVNWAHNGPRDRFYPKQTPTGFELSEILTPMERHKNDMLVLASFDLTCFREHTENVNDYQCHGDLPTLLTGYALDGGRFEGDGASRAGGPSVDQFIAEQLAQRIQLPFKSLALGAWTRTGPTAAISYEGAGSSGITPEQDPVRLFEKLFAGRDIDEEPKFNRVLEKDKSVLDLVGRRIEAFAARLGIEDRQTLDNHLTQIREMEQRIGLLQTFAGCSIPDEPGQSFGPQSAQYAPWIETQFDLTYHALKCDLTRVVTLQFGGSYNSVVYDDPELESRDGHDIAHNEYVSTAHTDRSARAMRFYWERVAYLIDLLKGTPEADGTMLDNTAVVVIPNAGENHFIFGIPVTIIGRCGGFFAPGRLMRFGRFAESNEPVYWEQNTNHKPESGVAHNRFLTSLCHAMDVDVAEYGTAGLGPALTGLAG